MLKRIRTSWSDGHVPVKLLLVLSIAAILAAVAAGWGWDG